MSNPEIFKAGFCDCAFGRVAEEPEEGVANPDYRAGWLACRDTYGRYGAEVIVKEAAAAIVEVTA